MVTIMYMYSLDLILPQHKYHRDHPHPHQLHLRGHRLLNKLDTLKNNRCELG
jgi:hypothetical protein